MCGIVGIVARPSASVHVRVLHAATDALKHRGPDDEGYLVVDRERKSTSCAGDDTDGRLPLPHVRSLSNAEWNIGLGHRRLSILDLSSAGHQPMSSEDGQCWITYNGEIYNYIELRGELIARGVRFRTECDTEVLIAAYREWGEAMFSKLVGMFAFAIVDLQQGRVLLARDPFGIKPLYYSTIPSGFCFASELKALLQIPDVSRDVDAGELYRYLRFGWSDGTDATFFKHIRQLPAASFLSLPLETAIASSPVRYWRLEDTARSNLSAADAAHELRRRFTNSLRLHLRSDVPVGACLSGGVDSSLIVQLMRDELGPSKDLHTFSYIAPDSRISERQYVELMVDQVHSRSHLVTPNADDLIADFDDLITTQDQPFGSTSIYAQYRVFRLAHDAGIKVLLDGQGSDELFGGYLTAISAQMTSLLAARRVADAIRLWRAGDFVWSGSRTRILLSSLGRFLPARLAGAIMPFVGESLTPNWMDGAFFRDRGVDASPRPQGRGRDALREELLLFTQSFSLPQLLRYEDRNSMRFSIESRVPFCTTDLAELAMSLPSEYLVDAAGRTKAVLRNAIEGIVPKAILERPKVGFTTPEREWLAHLRPWIDRQLGGDVAHGAPFLNRGALPGLVSSQAAAGGNMFRPSLWRILNVLRWSELVDARFV